MIDFWQIRAVRRSAALGLLFAVLVGLWIFIGAPLAAEFSRVAHRLSDAEVQKVQLTTRIDALEKALVSTPDHTVELPLWAASETNETGIAMQQAVRALSIGAELQLGSFSLRRSSVTDERSQIRLTVDGRGPYDRILRFVHAIARHEPLLQIDRLSLRTLPGLSTEKRFPELQLRLEISAPVEPRKVPG